jgi:hypothetical protein
MLMASLLPFCLRLFRGIFIHWFELMSRRILDEKMLITNAMRMYNTTNTKGELLQA